MLQFLGTRGAKSGLLGCFCFETVGEYLVVREEGETRYEVSVDRGGNNASFLGWRELFRKGV